MNRLDKKIRKMAKQTGCPVSNSYEERVEHLLENMNGENVKLERNNGFSMSKAGFATCVFCAALLVAVPVTAKVNSAVKERMESMSKKERKAYETMNDPKYLTKEHETEAIRYSRELSEDEEKREGELFQKYEEGVLFPEGEIQVVDKLEENMEITSPLYEVWNREFFLPERELTDEELLQMIDLMYKQSYALENSDEVKEYYKALQEFNENPNPGQNDMSEEEAVAKASAYLKIMYDIDTSEMEKTVGFELGGGLVDGGDGDYSVTFEGKDEWLYDVRLNGETGILTSINVSKGEISYNVGHGQPIEVDEQLQNSIYEKTKEKLAALLGEDIKVRNGNCEFSVNEDNKVTDAALYIPLELDNGCVYQFTYIVDEDRFGGVYTYGAEEGADLSDHVSREEDGAICIPMERNKR